MEEISPNYPQGGVRLDKQLFWCLMMKLSLSLKHYIHENNNFSYFWFWVCLEKKDLAKEWNRKRGGWVGWKTWINETKQGSIADMKQLKTRFTTCSYLPQPTIPSKFPLSSPNSAIPISSVTKLDIRMVWIVCVCYFLVLIYCRSGMIQKWFLKLLSKRSV